MSKVVRFNLTKVQSVVVVELEGDIWGGWDTIQLKDQVGSLLETGDRRFLIDLAKTNALNSAGIGVILACLEKVTTAGGSLKVCSVSDRSRRALSISEVWDAFDVHETRAAALASFGVQPPSDADTVL